MLGYFFNLYKKMNCKISIEDYLLNYSKAAAMKRIKRKKLIKHVGRLKITRKTENTALQCVVQKKIIF